jgi:hypothetical protein
MPGYGPVVRGPLRELAGTAVVLAVLSTGCASSDSRPTDGAASPSDSFPVGSHAGFTVVAHCGVKFATIDGITWRTRPRGRIGAPAGWPQVIQGTLSRPAQDRAVFVSDAIPVSLVFRPAPHATYTCY